MTSLCQILFCRKGCAEFLVKCNEDQWNIGWRGICSVNYICFFSLVVRKIVAYCWSYCFLPQISERDEEALKYIKDIKWCRIDDPKGFKLEFFFDTNPFFKNSVLTKIYHMIDDDEPILEKAIG